MPLRPRGPMRAVSPARRNPIIKDPFSNCSYCNKTLAGFVTPNVASSNEMTILLHCGHVLCKDCIIKQAEILNTATISDKLHSRTHVTCTKCKSVGFFHFLPSLKEVKSGNKCEYEGCGVSSPENVFCNNCKISLCSKCRFKHDGRAMGHTLVPSNNSSSGFTKKFLTCTRHTAIPATHICSGCGDAACHQCNNPYEDEKKIKHECFEFGRPPEKFASVEQLMHQVINMQTRLKDIIQATQTKKTNFDKKMELLKNELCKHAYYLVNAIIGRTLQLLGVLAKEADQMGEHVRQIELDCNDAMRRIDVSVEMDERVRDRTIFANDSTTLIFHEIAQSVFRPVLSQLSRIQNRLTETDFETHFVEISHLRTEEIASMICNWGSRVGSTTAKYQPTLRETELVPYDRQKPFDSIPRVFPDFPARDKISTMNIARSGDKSKDTFYLETFRKLWIASQHPSRGVQGELASALRVIPWAANATPDKAAQTATSDGQRTATSGQAISRSAAGPSNVVRDPRITMPSNMPARPGFQSPTVAGPMPIPGQSPDTSGGAEAWFRRFGFVPVTANRTLRLPLPNLRAYHGQLPVSKEETERMGRLYQTLRQHPSFARNDPKLLQALSLLMARYALQIPMLPPTVVIRLSLDDATPPPMLMPHIPALHSPANALPPPPLPHTMGSRPPIHSGFHVQAGPAQFPPRLGNQMIHPAGYLQQQPSTSRASPVNLPQKRLTPPEPVPASDLMGDITATPPRDSRREEGEEELNGTTETPMGTLKKILDAATGVKDKEKKETTKNNADTSTPASSSSEKKISMRIIAEPGESSNPSKDNATVPPEKVVSNGAASSSAKSNNTDTSKEKEKDKPVASPERIIIKLPRPHDKPIAAETRVSNEYTKAKDGHGQKDGQSQASTHLQVKPVAATTSSARSESPRSEATNDDTLSERSIDEDNYHKYCFVCNDINASEDEDKGMCAKCPRVFHARCHLPKVKRKWEDMPDDWTCGLCDEVSTANPQSTLKNATTRKLCYKVILSCYEHMRSVRWFTSPVPASTPLYREYVSEPIDLGTIAQRISRGHQQPIPDVNEFIRLMNLLFQNCSSYNPKGTNTEKAGRKVWRTYSNAVKKYLPDYKHKLWLYVTLYEDRPPAGGTPSTSSSTRKRRAEDGEEANDNQQQQPRRAKDSKRTECEPIVRLSSAGAPPIIRSPAMLSVAAAKDARSKSPSVNRNVSASSSKT